MTDREKRYTEGLEKCRANIERTKSLIEYHRGVLKSHEKKEAALLGKLKKEKLGALYRAMEQGGYDIDSLIKAAGADSTGMVPVSEEYEETEPSAADERK